MNEISKVRLNYFSPLVAIFLFTIVLNTGTLNQFCMFISSLGDRQFINLSLQMCPRGMWCFLKFNFCKGGAGEDFIFLYSLPNQIKICMWVA